MSSECLRHLSCCKSYDELTDIASTIQAYTSIHFSHEEWIKIRFFLMLYSCIIFMWTILDSIFSDRTLFYFIYATHWILLLNIMLYLICSYVITIVIHERISSTGTSNASIQISKRQKKKHNKKHNQNNHFEDMKLQATNDNIPSLSQLGLFKWNKFIVFLQNASLSPSILFPIIFWFVIFPNISEHSWYDVFLEFNIHGIIPILILFDFIFSSRTALYIDMYQPLIIGVIYCLWTYIIWTDNTEENKLTSLLYDKYFYFELHDYILWFIFNLSGLCAVHLTFAFIKSKVLSKHFMPIHLSTNHVVIIDKNGNIVNSKSKEYDKVGLLKKKKKKKKKKKQKLKLAKKVYKKQKVGVISELNEENDMHHQQKKVQNIQKKSMNNVTDHDTVVNINDEKNENLDDVFANFDDMEFFEENKNDLIEINVEKNGRNNIINHAGNSIKEGFKNLIARIDNKNEIKYSKPSKHRMGVSISSTSDDSSSMDTTSSDEDNECESHELDNSEYKMFYSLKGHQSDTITGTDEENGKFTAFKTRSLATLLNLSKKKLHAVSGLNKYNRAGVCKSEIEYSEQETSGLSDDEIKFGLKSGLYKKQ